MFILECADTLCDNEGIVTWTVGVYQHTSNVNMNHNVIPYLQSHLLSFLYHSYNIFKIHRNFYLLVDLHVINNTSSTLNRSASCAVMSTEISLYVRIHLHKVFLYYKSIG